MSYRSERSTPWEVLIDFAERLDVSTITLCYVYSSGSWMRSRDAQTYPVIFQSILHVAACDLQIEGCAGARVSHGARMIEAMPGVDETLLMWWRVNRPDSM